jgi:hypothetical protein
LSIRRKLAFLADLRKLKHVTGRSLRLANGTNGKFDDRVCRETGRDAPGRDIAPYLPDPVLLIDVHKIDRELHSEGVHSLARNNPHAFALRETLATKQALSSSCAASRDFDAASKLLLPRAIENV